MEAEHQQSTRTADEKQKLNAKEAVLAKEKQEANEVLAKKQSGTESENTDI